MNDAASHLPPGAELLGREWLGLDESGHGTIQDGFLAAMLDSATRICALVALSPHQTVVTKSLDTRFLKPATVGPTTARARVIERTERDMVVRANLVDPDGTSVADGTAQLRILAKK